MEGGCGRARWRPTFKMAKMSVPNFSCSAGLRVHGLGLGLGMIDSDSFFLSQDG